MLDRELFNKHTPLSLYQPRVSRVVESQESIATLGLVNTMEEHELLEEALDDAKPPYRPGTEKMPYLLRSPFRYPPLKHGSRFGSTLMPSLFYASEQVTTALAETAYYRLLFLQHMESDYLHPVDSQHSSFEVSVRSENTLDLHLPRYQSLFSQLTDPASYAATQPIGQWAMNESNTEIIRFYSARDSENSPNVAIINPKSIKSKKPLNLQSWICRTTRDRVSFNSRDSEKPLIFQRETFLSDGVFPMVQS